MKLPVRGVPMLPPGVTAPEEQTLRHTSHPKLYGIPTNLSPIRVELEGLIVKEEFQAKQYHGLPLDIGDYIITVEKPVRSSDELLAGGAQISALIVDLDKAWVYACGEPLEPVVIQLSFDTSVPGWQSNQTEIRDYLIQNCRQTFAVIDMKNQHWISMSFFPLSAALHTRDAYRVADPMVKALADIHYAALKSRRGEGRLFGLANGLELVRRLLPGSNDDAKQKNLLPVVLSDLRHSLHWLMDIANNRYNVRHVVAKGGESKLKPQFSGQEMVDFEHDADLIIRGVICQHLRIPCPSLRTGTPPVMRGSDMLGTPAATPSLVGRTQIFPSS